MNNLFPIASTVYLDDKILKKIDKLKICCVRINRNIKKIKSIRKIYTDNKNVVGKDIKLNKLKTINIINKGDKNFCKELLKLVKENKYLINYSNIQTNLLPRVNKMEAYKQTKNGIPLCFPTDLPIFNYDKKKSFKLSKKYIAKYIFKTNKLNYLGIKLFFENGDNFIFFAKPKKKYLNLVRKISFHNLRIKNKVSELNKKFKKVCAFQTRNIPHSGHEAIIKHLLKSFKHVVVNPVIGPKKKVILNCKL